MFKKTYLSSFIIVLSLQALITSSLKSSEGKGQQPQIDQTAPLFQLTSLDGDTLALETLRGKFVVIHFAASW
jgi:cytochrome oxidase Cu insertion factor (SCO1/SenC/PrrC family)